MEEGVCAPHDSEGRGAHPLNEWSEVDRERLVVTDEQHGLAGLEGKVLQALLDAAVRGRAEIHRTHCRP